MSPSLVSVMPCNPTRLGPSEGVMLVPTLPLRLPPLPDDLSLDPWPPVAAVMSLLAFVAVPHRLASLWAGDCDKTGLFCTLNPGDTARRLREFTSRSSSRRRLFDFLRPSAAEGGTSGCGVEDREAKPVGLISGLAVGCTD
jgi:hypothetical protein